MEYPIQILEKELADLKQNLDIAILQGQHMDIVLAEERIEQINKALEILKSSK